jgi:hypothetical protein
MNEEVLAHWWLLPSIQRKVLKNTEKVPEFGWQSVLYTGVLISP